MIGCLLIVMLLSGGCQKRPEGLPKPYPTTVTVTNAGQAIEGAKVTLLPATALPSVTIYGDTDANGKAVIHSLCEGLIFEGAPQGEYRVVVSKTPDVQIPEELSSNMATPPEVRAANQKKIEALFEENRIIPASLESAESTPLTLSVAEKGVLDVDISQYE